MTLPWSQAAANNAAAILEVLRARFVSPGTVVEVGAGTGQHAATFSCALPQLNWQPLDVPNHLPIINARNHHDGGRAQPALAYDAAHLWPSGLTADYIYTANTFHIMAEPLVVRCIEHLCQALNGAGPVVVYGPFNIDGQFTSDSNAAFHRHLQAQDPRMGIRDKEWVCEQFERYQLALADDVAMPANNRCLVFERLRRS